MKVGYRDIARDDVEAVIELQQNISSHRPNPEEIDRFWAAYIGQSGIIGVVAEANKEVIGFASLLLEVKLRGGIVGHIEDVVVSDTHRSSGIGRGLLQELIKRGEKCYKFTLCCDSVNVDFYKKVGFREGHLEMKLFPKR